MPYSRRYNAALGLGLLGAAAVGTIVGAWLDAGVSYPLAAAAFFGVLFVAVGNASDAEHPHDRFGPANQVTTMRAVLAGLVAGLIGHPVPPAVLWWVIGVTIVLAVLDGVDGWLARTTRMTSGFGARFDMETDAAYILVLSILVWQYGKAGAWVLLCGLMRYGFVAAGWALPWLARPLRPTRRGKTVAVVQVLGLGTALAPAVPPPASAVAAGIALGALAWSFAVDVAWLRRTWAGSETWQ